MMHSEFRYRFILILFALAFSGCGVLMGRTVTTDTESITGRKQGLVEPWDKTYSAIGTGKFDDKSLTADVEIRLARTDLCRQYTETEVVTRSAESFALGIPGLSLDAGVLAAGVLGSLFLPSIPAKGGVILGASIPLVVDGASLMSQRPVTTRTEVRKVAEVTPASDAKGVFACSVMTESWATVRFDKQVTATVDGVYRFRIDETQLMASGSTDSITMPLLITPKHVAQASRATVGHTLIVKLGPDFVAFAKARNETRRFGTLLRMAEYVSRYPASQLNEGVVTSFLLLVPSAADIDELQSISGLSGIDPELRKAVHDRYTVLRVEQLRTEVLEGLTDALQNHRDEVTFSRNGLREQALESQQMRERSVVRLCRLANELAERETAVRIGERNQAWQQKLAPTLSVAELTLVSRWLQGCSAPAALP